jgi:hypothetical protein
VDHKKTGETIIPVLDAPNDLVPKSAVVRFAWMPLTGLHRIEIRATVGVKEITLLNNAAARTFHVH